MFAYHLEGISHNEEAPEQETQAEPDGGGVLCMHSAWPVPAGLPGVCRNRTVHRLHPHKLPREYGKKVNDFK